MNTRIYSDHSMTLENNIVMAVDTTYWYVEGGRREDCAE